MTASKKARYCHIHARVRSTCLSSPHFSPFHKLVLLCRTNSDNVSIYLLHIALLIIHDIGLIALPNVNKNSCELDYTSYNITTEVL